MTTEELERITKLIALVQMGISELIPLIARLREQGGETTDQILAHAETANAQARKLIDAL